MPFYEYECEMCSRVTEAMRLMDDADKPMECAHCGSDETKRILSDFQTSDSTSSRPEPPCGGNPNPGCCGNCCCH